MSLSIDRRTALASVGSLISMVGAGCLLNQNESGTIYSLQNVRSYTADEKTAIVVGTVKRVANGDDNVKIRAELLFDSTNNHASTQTFVISDDLDERVIGLPFTYDSDFLNNKSFTSRAKIIRDGEGDSEWVTETER